MKITPHRNVLDYAEGVNNIAKRDMVIELNGALPPDTGVIPVQVLGELSNVLVWQSGRSRSDAKSAAPGRRDTFATTPTTPEMMLAAMDLATIHQFSIWDGVILAAASRAGCRLLLSEDLQDGFTWGGVTVTNPFALPRHTVLDTLLE